jgi:hypothetical protein
MIFSWGSAGYIQLDTLTSGTARNEESWEEQSVRTIST